MRWDLISEYMTSVVIVFALRQTVWRWTRESATSKLLDCLPQLLAQVKVDLVHYLAED